MQTFFPPLPAQYEAAWLYLTQDNRIMAQVLAGSITNTLILNEQTMRWEQAA